EHLGRSTVRAVLADLAHHVVTARGPAALGDLAEGTDPAVLVSGSRPAAGAAEPPHPVGGHLPGLGLAPVGGDDGGPVLLHDLHRELLACLLRAGSWS